MKKILLLLFCFPVFSQDYLEEVTKVFDNGKPMFVDYLDIEDLKKVKTDMFNENGDRVFSISFNKESGKPDGEFFDLINKGYFENGVLNCDNCMLVESNTPSVFSYNYDKQNTFITKGSVVNGRFIGEVEKYGYFESTYRRVDWESTRRYIQAGVNPGFRDVVTVRTGNFSKTPSEFIFFNQNGQIEGNYIKNIGEYKIEFDVKDDIIQTYVVKDGNGLVVDSLSNENKIWKINYKFKKNNGLIKFSSYENISGPSINSFNEHNDDFVVIDYDDTLHEDYNNLYEGGFYSSFVINQGKPSILDSNGLFSIHNEYFPYPYLESLFLDIDDRSSNYDETTNRDYNLFTIIYNYLVNDSNNYLIQIFDDYVNNSGEQAGGDGSLSTIKWIFESEGEENIFKKYLNPPFNKKQPFSEYQKYSSLRSFFSNVISLSNYLKSISEHISSDKSEVQEIYVWDYSSKKYVLVDFEKIIKIAEEKETTINSNDYFDDSDYIVWFTSDKNGEGEYTNEFDGYLENFVKMEQLGFSSDSENLNNYYRLYFEDVESLESYGVSGNWKLIGKDKIRLFTIISQPNPNNPNNQNDSSFNEDDYELKSTSDKNENIKFDWSDYEVWYTSDRNGDGEYLSEMESWVKNDKFITKVEQLGYKYDYYDKNTYYRVFLKDLLVFKNYKLNEGNKLITKDENELFIIFSIKN